MIRWLIRTVAGVLLVLLCVRLGIWQLDRNEQRSAHNAVIEKNIGADPVPLGDVATPGSPVDAADEWRPIAVTGHYDADHQLTLRLRPVDGRRGVHAITPLVTADGAALLIDRGFLPTSEDRPELPPPPSGEVAVTARLRQSEDGRGTGGDPATGAIRYLWIDGIADALPYPVFGGWAELISANPSASDELEAIPPPEIDAGNSLSYAIQWFLFAVVGVCGFVLLVRAEVRGRHGSPAKTGHAVEATREQR